MASNRCYHMIPLPNKHAPTHYVPCGRCIGCRLEYSRQMAARCMCEAQMHKENSFITLTYRDEALPWGRLAPTLVPKDLEKFWKRLRKEVGRVRYYACGEYGDKRHRPHYHAALFGFDFPDKRHTETSPNGDFYYSSDLLNGIWGHGNCVIGDLTFESAAYVARYVTQKLTGPKAVIYKEQGIEPEFGRMSRRPGIGAAWYEKYHKDVFPRGSMRIRGVACKPPRFFVNRLEAQNPLEFDIQKGRRKYEGERRYWRDIDLGAPKASVQERVKHAQIGSLTRDRISD